MHRGQLTWTAPGLYSSKPPQGGGGAKSASESGCQKLLSFGLGQNEQYLLDFIQVNGDLCFQLKLLGWRHLWSDWPFSADIWGTHAGRGEPLNWRMYVRPAAAENLALAACCVAPSCSIGSNICVTAISLLLSPEFAEYQTQLSHNYLSKCASQ